MIIMIYTIADLLKLETQHRNEERTNSLNSHPTE